MKKKVVVTGATGFIGKSLVPHLLREGYEIHALVREATQIPGTKTYVQSLSDENGLRQVLESINPEFVVHLASLVSPGRQLDDVALQIKSTIEPAAMMALALPKSVKLALFTRSADEYGNNPSPLTEESHLGALSTYGWAKLSAFHIVELVAKNRNLPVAWVRPFLLFGPGQTGGRFIPSVIHACLEDRAVDLTPCEQTRDFLYIADFNAVVSRILSNPKPAIGHTFNLSSETPRTLRSVADAIRAQIGKGKLNYGALPYRANENMNLYGSSAKYHSVYGPLPQTPFEVAIRETIEGGR